MIKEILYRDFRFWLIINCIVIVFGSGISWPSQLREKFNGSIVYQPQELNHTYYKRKWQNASYFDFSSLPVQMSWEKTVQAQFYRKMPVTKALKLVAQCHHVAACYAAIQVKIVIGMQNARKCGMRSHKDMTLNQHKCLFVHTKSYNLHLVWRESLVLCVCYGSLS